MNKKLAKQLAKALLGKDAESKAKGIHRTSWVDEVGDDCEEILAEWLQDWFEKHSHESMPSAL